VTDAATGKLKRRETPKGKPVAVKENGSLVLIGYRLNRHILKTILKINRHPLKTQGGYSFLKGG